MNATLKKVGGAFAVGAVLLIAKTCGMVAGKNLVETESTPAQRAEPANNALLDQSFEGKGKELSAQAAQLDTQIDRNTFTSAQRQLCDRDRIVVMQNVTSKFATEHGANNQEAAEFAQKMMTSMKSVIAYNCYLGIVDGETGKYSEEIRGKWGVYRDAQKKAVDVSDAAKIMGMGLSLESYEAGYSFGSNEK
ncbi:hypothetical protein [Kluyvera ascorbata]|uniref:hypothetical protein n=1 Tax=Kluyvera ascorbata TaxID=51288 RepID=UPI0030B1EF31|nr:hypothetical protein [Kluyvera ascorbata]